MPTFPGSSADPQPAEQHYRAPNPPHVPTDCGTRAYATVVFSGRDSADGLRLASCGNGGLARDVATTRTTVPARNGNQHAQDEPARTGEGTLGGRDKHGVPGADPTEPGADHPRSDHATVHHRWAGQVNTEPAIANLLAGKADPAVGGLALDFEHVTKRYGDHTVVADLSFTVPAGRVTGFLGPNGSGKSTAMKIMLDLAAADGGRSVIGGCRYRDLPNPAGTVGAVIESDAFHPGRSGRNHLRILADATGVSSARVDEILEQVGLADAGDRHAGAYSLGMRQRLGLAAALLGEPPVLILDEPGNGLDPQGIRTLRDLLRSHAAAGGTVFVSSHLLAEVELLADDVIVINEGRLVAHGSLAELQQAASLVRTADPGSIAVVLEQAGATTQTRGADGLVVRGMPIEEIGDRAFAAGVVLHELSPHAGSLEELFLDWTTDPSSKGEVIRP